ncbi:secondary thiamine-phosphate synthase enzyme YjbQ [Bowmanella denitrificans]|uniref:secondary thiamine-phosphate synthase enzyme YjbQ n=1 Tax=Bowmanella denitrificans TaxID=366582 RepID=UPI000C9CF3EA|nr:secondary thiamine-phosphate synthase enzyme YjbQ [Bowmanella denitrificans]
MSQWHQQNIKLRPKPRGFHLVTSEVLEQLTIVRHCQIGLLHLFIQHTSASLTVNENADPTVRDDFERHFNQMVPENAPYYEHTYEGADDMPAHLKASILGTSLSLPISNGRLALGTWQGIYLCEHRNQGGSRRLLATIQGQFQA